MRWCGSTCNDRQTVLSGRTDVWPTEILEDCVELEASEREMEGGSTPMEKEMGIHDVPHYMCDEKGACPTNCVGVSDHDDQEQYA